MTSRRTPPPPPPPLPAGVTGYMRNATYTVVARTRDGTPQPLTLASPQTGSVPQGAYDRYQIQFDRTQPSLQLTVTPATGDADLYARLDNVSVTTTSYQYSSTGATGVIESVNVSQSDPFFAASCAGTGPCFVTAAVYGYTASVYTIVASAGMTQLEDGVPM